MTNTLLRNREVKTGKNLDQRIQFVNNIQVANHKEVIGHLESEYSLTFGYANLIARKTRPSIGGNLQTGDSLVDTHYSGKKNDLCPTCDAIIEEVSRFGADVEFVPKKAFVNLRHRVKYAIGQPSTNIMVNVGINLKGTDPGDRLEPSGSINVWVSH